MGDSTTRNLVAGFVAEMFAWASLAEHKAAREFWQQQVIGATRSQLKLSGEDLSHLENVYSSIPKEIDRSLKQVIRVKNNYQNPYF